MNKESIYKFLYTVSIFLIIGFIIRLEIDFVKYDNTNNSTPFYTCIMERIVEFIVPSIVVFIVGKIMKKKYSK